MCGVLLCRGTLFALVRKLKRFNEMAARYYFLQAGDTTLQPLGRFMCHALCIITVS